MSDGDDSGNPVIEMRGVRKAFGRRAVLNGVDLTVPPGRTFAFLGRNGQGKTTTIRTLLGLLKPDEGTVRVLGIDPAVDPLAIRRRVGYVAEDPVLFGWMRVGQLLLVRRPVLPHVGRRAGQAVGGSVRAADADPRQALVQGAGRAGGAAVGAGPPAGAGHPRRPDAGPGPDHAEGLPPRLGRPPAGGEGRRLLQLAPAVRGRAGGRRDRDSGQGPGAALGRDGRAAGAGEAVRGRRRRRPGGGPTAGAAGRGRRRAGRRRPSSPTPPRPGWR